MDKKARLKLVYGVFVAKGSGQMELETVEEEMERQGHVGWSSQEVHKTLDMLVLLKLLQKDGPAWKLK